MALGAVAKRTPDTRHQTVGPQIEGTLTLPSRTICLRLLQSL